MTGNGGDALERFFGAVREGRAGDVRDTLARDPSLANAFDPNPWCCRSTPLNVAVSKGSAEMVDLLLASGADPNLKSDWWAGGFAPLHTVPVRFADVLVPRLLAAGARPDVHAAAHLGLTDVLTALLDEWPHLVNAPGGDGARPLHFARTPEVADLLADRDAWLDARCVDHHSTPVQWAVGERPDVARRLLERGASGDPWLYAGMDDVDRLTRALDERPELTDERMDEDLLTVPGSKGGHIYRYALGDAGYTLLHVAAAKGSTRAISLLAERGAGVEAQGGYDDQRPLHSAAWHDRPAAIRALLEAGADPEAASGPEHRTRPVVWAIVGGSVGALGALIDSGSGARLSDLEVVRAGQNGEFDAYTRGTRADFDRMAEMVEAALA